MEVDRGKGVANDVGEGGERKNDSLGVYLWK
jgi:hypothetical protein